MKGVALHCRHTWVILGVWLPFAWGPGAHLCPSPCWRLAAVFAWFEACRLGVACCAVSRSMGGATASLSYDGILRSACVAGARRQCWPRRAWYSSWPFYMAFSLGVLRRSACAACTCCQLGRGKCVDSLWAATFSYDCSHVVGPQLLLHTLAQLVDR